MKKILVIALLLIGGLSVGVRAAAAQRPEPNDPWVYERDRPNNWDESWNRRPFPRAGACFFTRRDFGGNRFCVRAGERLPALPGNFGDNISSIRTFGGARAQVYNDRNFRGGSAVFGNVRDLRNRRFRGGHTWNDRISSVAVM